jgi:hypothetical protein
MPPPTAGAKGVRSLSAPPPPASFVIPCVVIDDKIQELVRDLRAGVLGPEPFALGLDTLQVFLFERGCEAAEDLIDVTEWA